MQPEWDAVRAEVVSLLQALITFDTTNPPGNELPLAGALDGIFRANGVESRVIVTGQDRAAICARLRGGGGRRPVMLLSHMDVVGVERDKWSCDPFAGEIRDGYVYGRGAIDDKGMLAANVMTMLLLQRAMQEGGLALERDVVFLSTADEEAGGECGLRWLIENERELFDVEFVLNEGGRTRIIEGGKRYIAIQTSEKISHMVTLTARGDAGHAAIPLESNAIFALGSALHKLRGYTEPVKLNATTRRFFRDLSPIWPDAAQAAAMHAVASGGALDGGGVLSRIPVFNAIMRNGISPTVLKGGVRGNVIPAEASVVINVRTLPGQRVDEVIERMRAVIQDERVDLSVAAHGPEAPESDCESPMFHAISESARALDPELTVVPYLSTGQTDSAYLRRIGIDCFGLLPFPMHQHDEERMHGHDERVPIGSLLFGTRLIYDAILRVATTTTDNS